MTKPLPPPTSDEIDLYAREIVGILVSLPIMGRTDETRIRIQQVSMERIQAMGPQLRVQFTWNTCDTPGRAIIDEAGPIVFRAGVVQPRPDITPSDLAVSSALSARIRRAVLDVVKQEG